MSVQKPLHHLVDDDTYFFNLTLDFITLLKKHRRFSEYTNTWRGSSQDDIPRVKCGEPGDPCYQLFCLKYHLVGIAALDYLPINPAADL